ncbi:hypothetical protein RY831_26910 [Noviherbaspirillum sp. CPCC 100848]|uniref:Uncharacterized protein n=1 Tax=Noviherbaspirillum album TaxID=3080276 RepID=A0ABU6JGK1_9BURK|nr:hypothetical protein [Noviherbaspirillum sp. CPCC 100848]MEC4722795.1 hypothetical protein [Noviherbaspirillum sp. CPCC 100848]
MAITFVGGYTYRFTYQDGSHKDYMQAGGDGNDTLWRDSGGVVHRGAHVFQNVVAIHEVARPPQAINERR